MDVGAPHSAVAGADTENEVPVAALHELQWEIDARMRRGYSFSSLEDELIELSDLSEDEKSALWLYAWSFVDGRAQRREARAHIARLTRAAGAAPTAA